MSDLSQAASDETWNSSSLPDLSTRRRLTRLRAGGGDGVPLQRQSNTMSNTMFDQANPNEDDNDDLSIPESTPTAPRHHVRQYWIWLKIALLVLIWMSFTYSLMVTAEKHVEHELLTLAPQSSVDIKLIEIPRRGLLDFAMFGPLLADDYKILTRSRRRTSREVKSELHIVVQRVETKTKPPDAPVEIIRDVSDTWKVALVSPTQFDENYVELQRIHLFKLSNLDMDDAEESGAILRLHFEVVPPLDVALSIYMRYDTQPMSYEMGITSAVLVLVVFYVLIATRLTHRTFAVMFAATLAIGLMAAFGTRPTMPKIISWFDADMLLLVFGVTIIIAIFSETGIFDYIAVWSFQIFNGHIWPPINILLLLTGVSCAFLDNITVILCTTPICIRLCEVMNVYPVPVLICMMVFANIGTTLTPLHGSSNQVILLHPYAEESDVAMGDFLLHMLPGVLLMCVQSYFQLRLYYRKIRDIQFEDSPEVLRLARIITTWKRAAMGISMYSKDEKIVRDTLVSKVRHLRRKLRRLTKVDKPVPNFKQQLQELRAKYPLRNRVLLLYATIALFFVLTLFFLNSFVDDRFSLGWIAFLGTILLLLLADMENMESIMARVDWCTIMYLAVYFVLSEAFFQFGFMHLIVDYTSETVRDTDADQRLPIAILLVLWLSGLSTSFLDSITFTKLMMQATIELAMDEELKLPWTPLMWALAYGSTLGGTAMITACAGNIICSGITEQHGYKFGFIQYFRVGFPIMLGNLLMATIYLMIAHVACSWH